MIKNTLSLFVIVTLVFPFGAFAANPVSNTEMLNSLENEISHLQKIKNPSLINTLSDDEIREIINLGTNWLKAANEPDGHFAYEYFPYEDRYADDDNIVRQAGALFELGEITRRDTNNKYDLDRTIERSIKYFEKLTKSGKYNGKSVRCITSDIDGNVCKLGTTSLAFIGIINYVTANPDKVKKYDKLIEGYASYIISMQKGTGGFREVFSTSTNIAEEKESSYANGEAFLALVRYAKWKNYPTDLQSKIKLTVNYILSSKVPFDASLYLWAMSALKDWDEFKPDARHVIYARSYSDWRMSPFKSKRGDVHNFCPYIEGVVSAYSIMEDDLSAKDLEKYDKEIDFWLAKSALLQVNDKSLVKYDVMKNRFLKAPIPAWARGGFLTGHLEPSQRIDFTQHCLSAYMQKLVDIDNKSL